MGKRKGGKKADRKLNTQDVTDFLEKETREERQGLNVDRVPDAELFFVDKAGDDKAAAAAATPSKVSRKVSARQKVLRSQAILAGAHAALPVSKDVPRKPKGSVLDQQQRAKQQRQLAAIGKQGRSLKPGGRQPSAAFDPWDDGERQGDGWTDMLLPAKRQRRGAAPSARHTLVTAYEIGTGSEARRPLVPAVEIDPSGCSYNPDPELHQEAVAAAVAAETRKQLNRDLLPAPIPRTVDYQVETDELTLLQTLVGEVDEEQAEDGMDEGGSDDGAAMAARRKQRKLKLQRHELSSLSQIQRELREEEEENQAIRLRRQACSAERIAASRHLPSPAPLQLDKVERLTAEPPKLSKHKFQPMPLQVLTTEEVGGSLRRLKPTTMLAKDRYKSLQKRALIEPRRKIEQKKQGKKVEYVHGERADRAAERQQELQDLRKAKKLRKKKSSGTAAVAV
ncbi:Ribosome biogenesis protein NOP53 [Chlorella vulgaris]